MVYGHLSRDELRHFPMKIRAMWSGARHLSATLLWTVGLAGSSFFCLFVIVCVIGKRVVIIKSSV
jgi:hypothetical protein